MALLLGKIKKTQTMLGFFNSDYKLLEHHFGMMH